MHFIYSAQQADGLLSVVLYPTAEEQGSIYIPNVTVKGLVLKKQVWESMQDIYSPFIDTITMLRPFCTFLFKFLFIPTSASGIDFQRFLVFSQQIRSLGGLLERWTSQTDTIFEYYNRRHRPRDGKNSLDDYVIHSKLASKF